MQTVQKTDYQEVTWYLQKAKDFQTVSIQKSQKLLFTSFECILTFLAQ